LANVPEANKFFWMHSIKLLDDEAQLKLVLVCLEIVLILMHNRCTVCAEHTIG
jgi:hypothetical protein